MKICYLTHNIDPKSGMGRYSSDLIFGVKKSGIETVVLKEQDDGLLGMPVLKGGAGIFAASIRITKYLKGCDIIHALDGHPYGIIAALSNLILRKKLIITGLGTYAVAPLYNPKTSFLLRWAYKRADSVIAISNYTKNEIFNKIHLGKIEVIKPGIDFEKFSKEHIYSSDDFILSVGALKHRKGYHISIPAFAAAKKKFPGLKYKIVGSWEDERYFEQLKSLIKKNGIEGEVEFLTGISDDELGFLYQRAKIFILTSINYNHQFEGFGLVFLEAAATGTPVIGTFGNGIEDAMKHGYNGILVLQNNIEKTSQAIEEILADPEKWKMFSKNSYSWAEAHKLENAVEKYIEVYRRVLGS